MGQEAYRIWIARFRCTICHKTVTVLPTFLFPYFQYTIWTILPCINDASRFSLTSGHIRQGSFLPDKESIFICVDYSPTYRGFVVFFKSKGNEFLGCPMNHSFKHRSGFKKWRRSVWKNSSKRCEMNNLPIF